MKKWILMFLMAVGMMLAGVGCASTSTIKEYDLQGNLVKETQTNESVAATIVESTKNKSLVFWSSGWYGKAKAVFADSSSPVPTFDLEAGKVDTGMASIHKDQQNLDKIPDIIKATRSDLGVTSDGIGDKK